MYVYIYIYIYIYKEGDREREREHVSNVCLYRHKAIYIYIYMYILSGPWKLSGRFRCVSVIYVSATFPLRFRYVSVNVSVTFPSTFPLRFHWAGVSPMETIWKLSCESTFPLRFRWAIACPTNTALRLPQRQQISNDQHSIVLYNAAVRKTAARETAVELFVGLCVLVRPSKGQYRFLNLLRSP